MPALTYRTKAPRPDDPELIAEVVAGKLLGLSNRAIAAKARIGRRTLDHWLNEGQAELVDFEAGRLLELGSLGRFCAQVEMAAADFEVGNVEVINRAKDEGGNKWIPALAHITRRNPSEWAERRQVQIEQHSTLTVTVLPSLPEQQLLALVQDKLESGIPLLPPTPNP